MWAFFSAYFVAGGYFNLIMVGCGAAVQYGSHVGCEWAIECLYMLVLPIKSKPAAHATLKSMQTKFTKHPFAPPYILTSAAPAAVPPMAVSWAGSARTVCSAVPAAMIERHTAALLLALDSCLRMRHPPWVTNYSRPQQRMPKCQEPHPHSSALPHTAGSRSRRW